MPFSLKKKKNSFPIPHGETMARENSIWGRLLLGTGEVAYGCAWRKCGVPKAMPRWHVFPCMGWPILVQGTQAAVLLDRWRIRRWKLVCFTFHGSLSFRANKNGKAIASIINCAGIAVTEMCFPQCFLSVGCKFCIVDVLIKSNKNLFFHILTFLLYVNIMDF